MTVQGVANLVEAPRVALDEKGLKLWSDMTRLEREALKTLDRLGARCWRQLEDYSFERWPNLTPTPPSLVRAAPDPGRRRFVVLVPPAALAAVRSHWPILLGSLKLVKDELREHLAMLRNTQKLAIPNVGAQTTSLPMWLEPEAMAGSVTFSVTEAFRSSTIADPSLDQYLLARLVEVEKWIVNATKNSQHERVAKFVAQREGLSSDMAQVSIFRAMNGPLMARIQSGHLTRVRFGWQDRPSTQTTISHIVAAATTGPAVEMARAKERNRKPQYGEPIAKLLGGMLWIYPLSRQTTTTTPAQPRRPSPGSML